MSKVLTDQIEKRTGGTAIDVPATGKWPQGNIADDAVGTAQLAATGTASATTFLRGDNSWSAVDTSGIQANKDDIALLAFKTQANGSLARYNLVDQSVDAFEDASGVDAGTSTGENRNIAGKYYSGGTEVDGTTGGTAWDENIGGTDYRLRKFTTVGNTTFTVPDSNTATVLIVGGGGGAGDSNGASGAAGAGGLLYGTSTIVGSNTITVGAGGSGGSGGDGSNGGNSVAFGGTALGGGFGSGGQGSGDPGGAGGSGGGGCYGGGPGGAPGGGEMANMPGGAMGGDMGMGMPGGGGMDGSGMDPFGGQSFGDF